MNTVSRANDRQVAGTHYTGVTIQHWDYAAANGLEYFEGQITKYVSRWRKKHPTAKGRLDDVGKALHFAEKLGEVIAEARGIPGVVDTAVYIAAARLRGGVQRASFISGSDFCVSQNMHPADAGVVLAMEAWRLRGEDYLEQATAELKLLVLEAEGDVAYEAPAVADDAAVDLLAQAMKAELQLKRESGRGGWERCGVAELMNHASQHTETAGFVGSPASMVAAANYLAFAYSVALDEAAAEPGSGYVNQG